MNSTQITLATNILIFLNKFEHATSKSLAASIQTNPASIRRTIQQLKTAGFVSSLPGNKGFTLATSLATITNWDLYILFNNNRSIVTMHSPTNCDCPVGRNITSILKNKYNEIELLVKEELQRTTIQDIADQLEIELESETPLLINAKKLYLHGIEQGYFNEAINELSGDEYIQHSTGVKTGKNGFIEFFSNFTKRNPKRNFFIVNSFAQGNLAFLFVLQSLDNKPQWITMDIFRGDSDNKLVEHWDIIEAYTSIEQITFNDSVVKSNTLTDINNFLLDNYHQIASLKSPANHSANNSSEVEIQKVHQSLRTDSYFAYLVEVKYQNTPSAAMMLLKISDNKIIEYWDTIEPLPIEEDLKNSGKF